MTVERPDATLEFTRTPDGAGWLMTKPVPDRASDGAVNRLLAAVADAVYFNGFSKTQAAAVRLFKNRTANWSFLNFLPGPVKSFTIKEIKTFLRDQTQWSQLFLIAALVVIYVYNFKVLPIDKSPIKTVYLQNLFSFLNMGLALFVLTAVTGRFAYPAVSTEKDAFWLVKTSPGSIRHFLWIKFFIYYPPLLILTEFLIITTNILLDVTPFMMALSTATVFFLVPSIVAIGIGVGAAFPDFKIEAASSIVPAFTCSNLFHVFIFKSSSKFQQPQLQPADVAGRSHSGTGCRQEHLERQPRLDSGSCPEALWLKSQTPECNSRIEKRST